MSGDTEPYPLPPFPKNPIWSWGTPAEWRKNAVAAQNDFYGKNGGIMFNKMENYSDIETEILVKAFASNPKTIRTLASSMNMWYSKSERKIAIKMRSRIQARSKSESVLMNAVYVMSYLKEGVSTAVPVFYFQAADGTVSYIDLSARIYKSWKHFLESNVIDPSLCCYPVKGHYGQVQSEKNPPFDDKIPLKLEISESPSCGIVATGIRWTKTAFTYTTYIVMGASILLTAGSSFSNAKWITKLNAIAQKSNKYLQYANSAATVAFSIVSINDKLSHGGEFGGIVAETSLIVSNLVSVLTPAIQKQIITRGLGGKDLAEAGFSDLSPMAKMFLYMLSVSRCVTSCISVLSCVGAMLMKYMYGGTITATDYFHLASSLYTCYGAVTSPLTAKKIFEQVQQEHKMEIARNAKRSEANKATEAEAKQDAAATLKDGKTDANVDKTVDKASAQNDGTEADKHAKEASAGASVLAAAIAGGVLGKGADNGDNKADSGNGGVDGPEEPPNPSKDQNDPVDEDVGLRKEIVSTEDQKIAKKEERERLEAEFEEKYKDDEEAKAGFEYYKTNILAGLDANDYVVNDQLVRLIKTADDPKELFCELAFTKTTITIHRDVLLINGQLNIDGAAFSSYTNHGTTDIGQRLLAKIQAEKDGVEYVETGQQVSNRETILHTTAAINGAPTPLSEKEIADNKTLVKKHYRWTLETEVNEFETFLRQNNIDLKDKLTISQYNRLIQVCNDGNHQPEKWKVVMELTKRLNCDDPHAIAGLMEIVNERIDADYINNNPNPKAKTLYKRNQTTALLDGLKNNSEDAFVNKIEERINHFKTRYENGDENLANFHEVAAEAGAEAAAYEAYGHGLKKFHKTYKGNPPPGENQDDWIETYLRRGTRGDVALSQDGLFWKPKPTPMVNSPPQPVP